MSKLGFFNEILEWRRMKWGSEVRLENDLHMDLNLKRDLMGNLARIWRIRSWGSDSVGGFGEFIGIIFL